MAEPKTFTLTREVSQTFKEGWGVLVDPIYSGEGEDNPDAVSDIDVSVVRIEAAAAKLIGNAWCVSIGSNYYCPIENFADGVELTEDDTHDLRSRWFETEEDAREHARYTQDRWDNPAPWVSFVRTW